MTRPWLLCLCLYGLLSSLAFSSSPRRFLQSPAPIDDENPPANTTTTSSRFDDQVYRIEDELEYISILMMGYTYFGSWQTTPDKIPPGYSNPGGMALLATLYQTYDEILADFQFSLFIYDGDFIDQGIMRLNILQNISTITSDNYLPNSTLALSNTVVNLTYGDPLANMTTQACNSNVTVQFLNKTSGEPFQPSFEFENDIFSFGLQLSIESQACGLSFNTSILNQDSIADQASSVVYTVLMSLAAIFQCIACQYLITGLEDGRINVRKISLGSIRLINAFDFFLCLINLGRFMDNSLVVGFTAIPFAVLSLHFEFKLIVVVVTLQSRLTAMDTSKLNFSNCIWLLISMVSVIIGGVYGKPTFIYIVFSLTQMPQIIQNFLLQQRQRWNCCFLLTLTLPKIGYLAYMLTSSENIFRRSPNPGLFAAIMIILAMQFVVLLAQTRRPRLCKKEDVFYKFYDATDKETIGQDVCCICLEKLSSVATPQPDTNSPTPKDPKEASFLSSSTDVSINEGQKQTMVSTPCNHAFHESCLKEWVKQKLECPYCRCNLPEMPGEED